MKIALIHLIGFESDLSCVPLNMASLASYIRVYGGFKDIKIIGKDIINSIKNYKPDIVGISVVSHQFSLANKISGEIKKFTKIPLIIGGPHISALPEQLKNSNFDMGVVGEGEQTFLEFLKYYQKSKNMDSENLKKINGLVFKDKFGKIVITKKRELIKDLDSLPFPALDILEMKENYSVPGPIGDGLIGIRGYLMTSRGCPYNCVYCASNVVWERTVRWQSAERVVNDIKIWVNRYGTNYFIVFDDIMMANVERFKKIIYLLEKEGLTKKIKFALYARANLINDEMCKLLKRINVDYLSFGLESGSERMLKYLKKGTVTVEQGQKAVKLCNKYGFRVCGYFIVGSPGEKIEDLKETFKFLESPYLNSATIFCATPLPGTELWDYAIKNGMIKKDYYESSNRANCRKINEEAILSKDISKEELEKWHALMTEKAKNKDSIKNKLHFDISMIKFFFYPRLYVKLWKKRKYVPYYIKRILRL